MSYLEPSEFVVKMVDAGESKVYMSTKDTLIRAFMAGAILALATRVCHYCRCTNRFYFNRCDVVSCRVCNALPYGL